jgi:hypothetical protein
MAYSDVVKAKENNTFVNSVVDDLLSRGFTHKEYQGVLRLLKIRLDRIDDSLNSAIRDIEYKVKFDKENGNDNEDIPPF